MTRFLFVIVFLALCSCLTAEESLVVDMELSPQSIDPDFLRYQLLPREAELKRGNAAAILLRLPWDQAPFMNQVFPKLIEWGKKPLHDPDWDEPEPGPPGATSRGLPARFYEEMKRAAYRSHCDWDYPIDEVQPQHFILLPDVQGMRGFAAGISAEARGHIARHKFAQAREAILVGLANARHLSQTPFEIIQMSAAAMQMMMLTRTAEMMGEPDSPNLYWALSTLPKEMLQLERAADFEGSMFATAIPAIRDLDRSREDGEWARLLAQILDLLESIDDLPKATFLEKIERQLKLAAIARRELPTLMSHRADSIESMSDSEAIVRLLVLVHTRFDNRVSAVMRLSPGEAWPELKKLSADMTDISARTGLLRNISNHSNWSHPLQRFVIRHNIQRRIRLLRIIEAVRDFVAAHDGHFPKTLSEITNVPIPLDPLTELPFQWTLIGDRGLLKPPPLPVDIELNSDELKMAIGKTYRLKIRVP